MLKKHIVGKWIGNVLMATGAAVLLLLAFGFNSNQSKQSEHLDAFAAMKADAADQDKESVKATQNPEKTGKNSSFDQIEGVLDIPEIDLHSPVLLGADDQTLAAGLGAIENMDSPGETGGSYAIAGHQSYVFGHYFNRLHEVETGQEFTFETVDGIQQYEVFDIQIVKPEQVEVLKRQDGLALLSLITCYPERSNEFRLVVQAKRIN